MECASMNTLREKSHEQTVTVLQAVRGQERFTYEYDFLVMAGSTSSPLRLSSAHPHALKFALCLGATNALSAGGLCGPGGF